MALQCRVYAPIFLSLCDFGAVPFYLEHVCMLGEARRRVHKKIALNLHTFICIYIQLTWHACRM